ncbi:MAG TPA: tRNA lysidine(34) synthetase TilS [Planctomycetes bacterium]|nr:tRNA lysidine(34) synthetase TilS [Planctomycetota bacterium]
MASMRSGCSDAPRRPLVPVSAPVRVHPEFPLPPAPVSSTAAWSLRWGQLARAAGIQPSERLLLALSGGADSVLLLHLLAGAQPKPEVIACHVDHGLRGEESDRDADFVETLCRSLDIPFERRAVEFEADGPSLEARAREARYRALIEVAEATGHGTILTGHHSDDALETLLMRWVRGTGLPGLRGARRSLVPGSALRPRPSPEGPSSPIAIRIVRPLFAMRREEVRRLLSDRGLAWREDSSNRDPRFTRSRVRHGFLPFLERTLGPEGIDNLRAFGGAVEALEVRLAGATAHLAWAPSRHALASRPPGTETLGGTLPRSALMRLASPLRRRALWRLLTEGTGHSPGRVLLEALLADLAAGRCTRHALPGRWTLVLRSSELQLLPPASSAPDAGAHADLQSPLPFPVEGGPARRLADLGFSSPLVLPVPGIVSLPDGRRVSVESLDAAPPRPSPGDPFEVLLDADRLGDRLTVRWPRTGDRFHALGAPGSKPLRRFLADRGVPREDRAGIPLVVSGSEILWIAGIEIAHDYRVRADTRSCIRLSLHLPRRTL